MKTITHASVWVKDYDEALAWYTEKLGFVVRNNTEFMLGARWVTLAPSADANLELVLQKPLEAFAGVDGVAAILETVGKAATMVISTDDCHGDVARLEANGVVITSPPQEMAWGISANFADLYGNNYNLLQSTM